MNGQYGNAQQPNRYMMNGGTAGNMNYPYQNQQYPNQMRYQQQAVNMQRAYRPQTAVYPSMTVKKESTPPSQRYPTEYYQRPLQAASGPGSAYMQQATANSQFQSKKPALSPQQYASMQSMNGQRVGMAPTQQTGYLQRPLQKPLYNISPTVHPMLHSVALSQQLASEPPKPEAKFSPLPESICPLESKRQRSEKEFAKLYTFPDRLMNELFVLGKNKVDVCAWCELGTIRTLPNYASLSQRNRCELVCLLTNSLQH